MNWQVIEEIIEFLASLFSKPQKEQTTQNPIQEQPKEVVIDWSDSTSKVSNYFSVHECLYLPSWKVMHIPSEEEKQNIIAQAKKMDMVRDFLGIPLNVHCWIRPVLNNPGSEYNGKDYNAFIKGAKNSAHKYGKATDWSPVGMSCEEARQKLIPKLDEFDIRMENNGPEANWVHNDIMPVIAKRYFVP